MHRLLTIEQKGNAMHLTNPGRRRLIGFALAMAVALAAAACGSSHPRTGTGPATAPGTTPPSASPIAASPSAAAITPTAAASPADPAGPAAVPAGFQPASASFPSPASGFVLGGAGCQPQRDCTARLVATADGGTRWRLLTAPDVPLLNNAGNLLTQASSVSSVVFASQQDGWLYGPGLWSTRDGGAHWRQITLGGAVVEMAVSSGTAYAVIRPLKYLSSGGPAQLFSSPAGRDAWARVGSMTAGRAVLAVSGRAAWFASASSGGVGGSTYAWATADGVHWHQFAFRCPQAYYGLSGIAAASPSQVVFLCAGDGAMGSMGKEVLSSSDGGRTVHLAGQAPLRGDPYGIAVPPGQASVITLAAASGISFLDRSANGGKTWAEVSYPTGGAGWSSLSYVSPAVGWVVLGGPASGDGQLLQTSDAGATWHLAGF